MTEILSYRNQSTNLLCKSVAWCLCNRDLRYEKFSYFQRHSVLDVWEGSEYKFAICFKKCKKLSTGDILWNRFLKWFCLHLQKKSLNENSSYHFLEGARIWDYKASENPYSRIFYAAEGRPHGENLLLLKGKPFFKVLLVLHLLTVVNWNSSEKN